MNKVLAALLVFVLAAVAAVVFFLDTGVRPESPPTSETPSSAPGAPADQPMPPPDAPGNAMPRDDSVVVPAGGQIAPAHPSAPGGAGVSGSTPADAAPTGVPPGAATPGQAPPAPVVRTAGAPGIPGATGGSQGGAGAASGGAPAGGLAGTDWKVGESTYSFGPEGGLSIDGQEAGSYFEHGNTATLVQSDGTTLTVVRDEQGISLGGVRGWQQTGEQKPKPGSR